MSGLTIPPHLVHNGMGMLRTAASTSDDSESVSVSVSASIFLLNNCSFIHC